MNVIGQGYNFPYDAIRYQWRSATNYSWYGTQKAKANCDKISAFFKNIGVANIKDGYTFTGNPTYPVFFSNICFLCGGCHGDWK